jgi:hypothetical protein
MSRRSLPSGEPESALESLVHQHQVDSCIVTFKQRAVSSKQQAASRSVPLHSVKASPNGLRRRDPVMVVRKYKCAKWGNDITLATPHTKFVSQSILKMKRRNVASGMICDLSQNSRLVYHIVVFPFSFPRVKLRIRPL